jgi:hypothetical protein
MEVHLRSCQKATLKIIEYLPAKAVVVVDVEVGVGVEAAGLDVALKNAITQLLDHNDGYVRNKKYIFFFFSASLFPSCNCSVQYMVWKCLSVKKILFKNCY